MSNFNPFDLYRNAGDAVYKPYPMKPEIRAKLERQGVQVVYPRRLRQSPAWRSWRSWLLVLAVVLRVSALSLLMYVVFLLVR
jgi:hypothetical protein